MIQSIDDDPITKPLPVLPASATLPGAKTDQAYLSLVVLVNNVSDENTRCCAPKSSAAHPA